jgi:hypothetical protein
MHLDFTATTVEPIGQLKFELLAHPPYSLDLAPLGYHMFGPLNKPCMDEDLPVMTKLWTQCVASITTKTFFADGIKRFLTATQYVFKKEVIMMRNDTLHICHRLLYMK